MATVCIPEKFYFHRINSCRAYNTFNAILLLSRTVRNKIKIITTPLNDSQALLAFTFAPVSHVSALCSVSQKIAIFIWFLRLSPKERNESTTTLGYRETIFLAMSVCRFNEIFIHIFSGYFLQPKKKNNELFGNHEKEIVATVLAVSATSPPLVNNFENLLHYKLLSLFTR